jgi:hypothetical protein
MSEELLEQCQKEETHMKERVMSAFDGIICKRCLER